MTRMIPAFLLTFAPQMTAAPLKTLLSHPWAVLILLLLLSLVMRFFSFFTSVIDHDESTYILIADALRNGEIYLKDVIDTKPIGIFILFGFFQTLFGKSILVIRIITALWIALTAWGLYLVHREFLRTSGTSVANPAPAATGIIYLFATSTYTYYGIAPNTELFFALFSVLALLIILRHTHVAWFMLSGLLLGLGFMIKYVVLFDALAIGLFYVWQDVRKERPWSHWFVRGAAMALGFLIPLGLTWLYYLRIGLGDVFYFYSFELSSRYFTDPPIYKYIFYVVENFVRFFPLTIWYFISLWYWRITGPALPFFALLWGALAMFIILVPGKLFGHYFLQFLLPMSLLAGSFFDDRRPLSGVWRWIRRPGIGWPILIVMIVLNIFFQKKDYYDKPDYPRLVAAFLKERLEPGDILYTGDYHHIVYHLTGMKSPTAYIHRSLIWDADNYEALGITADEAFDNIFLQKPRFVLVEKELKPDKPVYHYLLTSYTLIRNFDDKVLVYERVK